MIDLRQGDAISVLAGMPAESVAMCCTSPPYFGLRRYSGAQELVWGGRQDCAHEWGTERKAKQSGGINNSFADKKDWALGEVSLGQFCELCGAWHGAFGAEPSPELYLAHTLEVLRAIRRVLRADGTVWWNIDDTRWGGKGQSASGWSSEHLDRPTLQRSHHHASGGRGLTRPQDNQHLVIKPTDLCLIPQRLAILAQEDGWYIHSDIIWAKDSTMPESVRGWRWEKCRIKTKAQATGTSPQRVGAVAGIGAKPQRNAPGGEWQGGAEYEACPGCPKCAPNDGYVLRRGSGRPTDSYEHILVLSKTDKYFWDSDGYREPQTDWNPVKVEGKKFGGQGNHLPQGAVSGFGERVIYPNPDGRNVRAVWRMNPDGYAGAHFATFPSELPRRAILLGTSAKGCCPTCGAPWARVVERESPPSGHLRPYSGAGQLRANGTPGDNGGKGTTLGLHLGQQTLGWRPTCAHPHTEAETQPAVVLDPFMGTGTTLAVALELGRSAIGIDISEDYLALARKRLAGTTRGMRI